MNTTDPSYRALRRLIGILGIALPILLILGNSMEVQSSISYSYYTKMSVVFTGILFTFGLILITYRGSENSNQEYILTNIGGFCALVVALVPTIYNGTQQEVDNMLFYAHVDSIREWIHNLSAVSFLLIMGLVVRLRFPLPGYHINTYKTLSTLVFIGLGFAIFAVAYEEFLNRIIFNGAVFWGESLALWSFGIAWLRRGVHYQKKVLWVI